MSESMMMRADPMPDPTGQDSALATLVHTAIPSNVAAGVTYRLGRVLAQGQAAITFLAQRTAPEGDCPVVVKLLRPSFVRESTEAAMLALHKEAALLGRASERVPPAPFVVRTIDVGTVALGEGRTRTTGPMDLPWIALERVNGGAEGV